MIENLKGGYKTSDVGAGGFLRGWEASGEARWKTVTNEDIISLISVLIASASEINSICYYGSVNDCREVKRVCGARLTASRIRICIFAFIATEFVSSEIRTGAASSFALNPPAIFHGVGEEIREPRWIGK